MARGGMDLQINETLECEFEFELIDESFDHELGTHRMIGVKVTELKVWAFILNDWVEISSVLPKHLLEEFREKCAQKIDPYVGPMLNGVYQGEH